jgi:hypothetical protein
LTQRPFGFKTWCQYFPGSWRAAFAAAGAILLATWVAVSVAPAASPAAEGAVLRVSGGKTTRLVSLTGDTFALSWRHSVELTEWRETFVVLPDGRISLALSEYASAGAGLPDRLQKGERFRSGGGRMRISGQHVVLKELKVLLSNVSGHVLWAGERRFDLNALFGEGPITIRVDTSRKKERER